jgi:hypothetical protein
VNDPSVCGDGCECCQFLNGNNRCLEIGICESTGIGTVVTAEEPV